MNCPTCASPHPGLHPAGQVCADGYHADTPRLARQDVIADRAVDEAAYS